VKSTIYTSVIATLIALSCSVSAHGGDTSVKRTKKVDFARDIRPILANHCWSCHGPDEKTREAGLRLDLREAATAKLKSDKIAIVPGNVVSSTLVTRIEAKKESHRMPPPESKKPLNETQKQLVKRWIEQGAEYNAHWAFSAPKRPALPTVKDKEWVRNPIDAFVLARLEEEGLKPSPAANKETLMRRVSLDLTGLPPTLEELDLYLNDKSPNAYEKAVDRLLASPRYAERMALPWLDAARYADTNGYNNDEERFMWPWRDWVIESFRTNMPYDKFIIEQIAGDLLPNPTLQQRIATGFNRNHVLTTEGGIFEEEYRVEYVADRVHTTATAFLGLSMQCARCHDHKYDPIAQKEYYQFFAFFNNINEKVVNYNKGGAAEPFIRIVTPENQAKLAEIEKRRAEIDLLLKKKDAAKDADTPKHKKELADLDQKKAAIEKVSPPVMVMAEMTPPRQAYLLKRGQYDQRGDKVDAAVPAMLPKMPKDAPANRLGLARWLVDPANPLTARVAVNRWWAMYFGAGLVETTDDFGLQGDLPSHPELLDWLATEFVSPLPAAGEGPGVRGWDVKRMQKLIVTSATYRQSSRVTKELFDRDPKNRLLAHATRQRLPAETIRDNALAISGLLKEKIGGPSVKPYQPAGLWEDVSVNRGYKYVADKGDGLYRRSMYTFWRRTCPPPSMMLFDAPDRETCFFRRARTNTPLHALVLLNDPTYLEAARKLAERVMHKAAAPGPRLALAFRLALARTPTDKEAAIVLDMYQETLAKFRNDPAAATKLLSVGDSPRDAKLNEIELAAYTTVMNLILNLDEAITKQ
jgi:hypothetical protein